MNKLNEIFSAKLSQYLALGAIFAIVIVQSLVRNVFALNLILFILTIAFVALTVLVRKSITCDCLRNLFYALALFAVAVTPLESAIRIGSFVELVLDIVLTGTALVFAVKAIFKIPFLASN